MFSPINAPEELIKIKQKHAQAVYLINQQISEAVKKGGPADEFLLKRLRVAAKPGKWNEQLDKNKVFSVDDIKTFCVQFRMRFIDYKEFNRGSMPGDSIVGIKDIEKELGRDVPAVKVITSAKSVNSNTIADQVLVFAKLDDVNYYLIYQSGQAITWYKKWLAYPLRSIWTLLVTLIVVGLPLMFIIPAVIFRKPEDVQYYQMLYLAAFTIYTFFTMVFGGFTFYKRFSMVSWNKPYLG
jgi:hypothetical protein